jgi:DNA-binding NtrC family response regulator
VTRSRRGGLVGVDDGPAVRSGTAGMLADDPLLTLLAREIERREARRRQAAAERRTLSGAALPFLGLGGGLRRAARKLAESEAPILLLGEPGTGKKLLARWLHENGLRAARSYVEVPSGTLSGRSLERALFGGAEDTGLLVRAHRGTLFLHEIADLDPELQPCLLELAEQGDVRLIAATRYNLGEMVRAGRFHAELHVRSATVPLHVPPLRERRRDIPVIASVLIERLAADLGRGGVELTPCAFAALQGHGWPGNVRELCQVIEGAVRRSVNGRVDVGDLRLGGEGQPLPSLPGKVAASRVPR